MVYVYFRRAGLALEAYNRTNFFIALYVRYPFTLTTYKYFLSLSLSLSFSNAPSLSLLPLPLPFPSSPSFSSLPPPFPLPLLSPSLPPFPSSPLSPLSPPLPLPLSLPPLSPLSPPPLPTGTWPMTLKRTKRMRSTRYSPGHSVKGGSPSSRHSYAAETSSGVQWGSELWSASGHAKRYLLPLLPSECPLFPYNETFELISGVFFNA